MTGKHLAALALAACVASATAGPAAAASGVNVGVLKCTVDGGIGMILGSSKDMKCHFAPAGGAPEEIYKGKVIKIGIDIGVTGPGAMAWAVFAPTEDVRRGALAGDYVGASAEATVGVGAGANILVGGSDETISLQPLSVQGQTGLNAALAVSGLALRPL